MNVSSPPTDRALRGIVISNAITLVLALWQQWTLLQLMWPFWMQSVIIGYYARRRMLALEDFSTEGLRMNERPVPETPAAKRKVANFFVLHYGGFHAAYLVHREHAAADLGGRPNLGTLMFMPYARVVPMHLTIIFGTQMGGGAVWLFVLLKTVADVVMHKVEHRLLQRPRLEVAR